MEDQLWKGFLRLLKEIHKPRRRAREKFSGEEILCVWFWAVLHDRPVSWATCKANWPIHERRRTLPSSSTMSRRLRDREVQALMTALEQTVFGSPDHKPLVWVIDGKPLMVNGSSGDRQTGFGRAHRGNGRPVIAQPVSHKCARQLFSCRVRWEEASIRFTVVLRRRGNFGQ